MTELSFFLNPPILMLASAFNLMGPDLFVIVMLFMLVGGAFTLWMVIDCALHETSRDNLKLVWLLIILFVPLGSVIYSFVRKSLGPRDGSGNGGAPVLRALRRDCPHCGAAPEASATVCPVCGGAL